MIRQQPTKNANFASGGLSKDRRSSETSARNRVKIEASGQNDSDGKLAGIISIGDVVKHRLEDLESETNVLRDAYMATR